MSFDKSISNVRAEVAKRFDFKNDAEIDAFFIGLEESAKDNQEGLEKRDRMLRDTVAELCEAKRLLKAAISEMPTADVQPVKHGRWIEIEPILRLIEHIQMMLTTIYDTGGCIQSGDMKCLIETSDRLKELVKESGCYMREEGESDG